MKIAVITDDSQTISQHFGRAAHYLVFEVQDGAIAGQELRSKAGHRQFASLEHSHDHAHDHDHGQSDPRGHGYGADADRKHAAMVETISDCDVLLVRGMGRGAYEAMQRAGIRPVVTDIPHAEAAVLAYLRGEITDHIDRLH